jgi:hypothetical protein
LYFAGPVYVSSSCFDRYRQHAESSTQRARQSGQSLQWRRRFLRWLKMYLRERDCHDREVAWMLRKALIKSDFPNAHRALRKVTRAFGFWRPSQRSTVSGTELR